MKIFEFKECNGCNQSMKETCRIRFIEKLRIVCMCRNCLVKPICTVSCKPREYLYKDLPWSIAENLNAILSMHDNLKKRLEQLEYMLNKEELFFEVSDDKILRKNG
ncbi:MAG: hypothetical protein ACFFG0_03855 [Candidatus Thorarchaeota archaeon]